MKETYLLGEGKFSKVYRIGTQVVKCLKNNYTEFDEFLKMSKRELYNHSVIKNYLKDNPNLPPELYKNILLLNGYYGSHLKKESDKLKSRNDLELIIGDKIDLINQHLNQLEIFYFDYYKFITLSDYIDDSKIKLKKLFLANLSNNSNKIGKLRITQNILQGLSFLHKLSISHHDLKVENIILVNNNNDCYAKIIDLGLAAHEKHLPNNKSYVTCGSTPYMSPEKIKLYNLTNSNVNLSDYYYDAYKSDIWAVGIILYMLCYKKFPFNKAHKDDTKYQLFLKNNYDLENMKEDENKVISLMLQEDIKKRSSINNIIDKIDYIIDFKEKEYKTPKNSKLNTQNIISNNSSFEYNTPIKTISKKRKIEFNNDEFKKISRNIHL